MFLFLIFKNNIKNIIKPKLQQCSVVIIENKVKYVIHPLLHILKVLKCYKLTSNSYQYKTDFIVINDFETIVDETTNICTIKVNVNKVGTYRIGSTPIMFKVYEERSDFKDTVIDIPDGVDYLDIKSLICISDKVDDIIEKFDDFNKSNNQGIFLIKEYDLIVERILKSKDVINYKKIGIDNVIRVTSKNLVNGKPLKIFTNEHITSNFVEKFEKYSNMNLDNKDFISCIGKSFRLHDTVNVLSDESCKHILDYEPIVVVDRSVAGDKNVNNYYLVYMTSYIDKVEKMLNNHSSIKSVTVCPVVNGEIIYPEPA